MPDPIWLTREGNDIVVLVEVGGEWYEAIRERDYGPGETNVSHIWEGKTFREVERPVAYSRGAPEPQDPTEAK